MSITGGLALTRTWRRALVTLAAVVGVLAGLLAMHVLDAPTGAQHGMAMAHVASGHGLSAHAASTHDASAHMAATATTQGASADASCAAGGCDPTHAETPMACTLALLAATILLLAPAVARALLGIGSLAAPALLTRAPARAAESPPPPSLLALSVDRR
ncbi:hypothetical protein [Leifsonia xyli]|uniref:hypothetical protein n=1 Tax=Leifsonia xyli TaxID=1575 RepID=UPI003D665DC6